MKIHPHHDLIIAYLEDKIVQYQTLDTWVDIPKITSMGGSLPPFHHSVIYRLKPVPKPNRIFNLRVKEVGEDIVARPPEHWEKENVQFEIDSNTGKLISVRLIGD